MKKQKPGPSGLENPDTSFLKGKTVLITGGTGSFGKHCVRALLKTDVHRIVIFSRDELKQHEMTQRIPDPEHKLRYFIGDVRDKHRLGRAFYGVDYVIHSAALKQVPTLEYNPFEAILTNVIGAQNVIDAAIDQGVKHVVALSTDKAVNPINLYGASKLCAEKLFVAGNSYAGGHSTRFSVVRYGNVVGSRGSIVPLFLERRAGGVLPVTDSQMTRFWITLDQGVGLVFFALANMQGGEIFVPKIASMKIMDLAKAMGPKCQIKIVGIRPGEKLHEALATEDELARTLDTGDIFVIKPQFSFWGDGHWKEGTPVPSGFRYTSDSNDKWITSGDLLKMVDNLQLS